MIIIIIIEIIFYQLYVDLEMKFLFRKNVSKKFFSAIIELIKTLQNVSVVLHVVLCETESLDKELRGFQNAVKLFLHLFFSVF